MLQVQSCRYCPLSMVGVKHPGLKYRQHAIRAKVLQHALIPLYHVLGVGKKRLPQTLEDLKSELLR